jgi:flagellar protein FlaG
MTASNITALNTSPTPVAATAVSKRDMPAVTTDKADAVSQTSETGAKPSAAELQKAVDTLNKFVKPTAHSINFSVDTSTGKTVIKVMDTENNTVLQQFPSADALSMARALDKLQGVLVKETA